VSADHAASADAMASPSVRKRAPDSESFDVAVIYTTARGKIARMEFVR